MDNRDLDEHVKQTMEVGSKSFAAASTLFDPATRRSVLMLYAWCRYCDDMARARIPVQGCPAYSVQQRRRLA